MQWSCMARSISIDDLTFAQVALGTDSLVVEYIDLKADQKGERTSPKNCYANPFDYRVCIFTALGCYFCLHDETWHSENDTIFRNRNAAQGTAAHRYCEQIKDIYTKNRDLIEEFVRAGHFNPHGTRKGAAVCASSGTTLPASLAAIANRGEWTINMMFEVYLGFAEPGDQYLGRLLAGLLPNSADFAVIPPHFSCGMENDFVAEAMHSCFKGILDDGGRNHDGISLRSNTKALLLRCLALMVHNSGALLELVAKDPSHPFTSIPILCNHSLLLELKKVITSEPSDRIRMATGIPPHVEAMGSIQDLTSLIKQEREDRLEHYEQIKVAIAEKIEEVADENGQITRPSVIKMFDEFGSKFESAISSKIDSVLRAVQNGNRVAGGIEKGNEDRTERVSNTKLGPKGHLWSYKGRFWSVPENFEVPKKVRRRRGWELWLQGMNTPDGKKVCPFREFTSQTIPPVVYKKMKIEWQPILRRMEKTPNLPALENVNQILVDYTFNLATDYLKSNICSFLFQNNKKRIESWTLGTWSKCTQYSYIKKNGSEVDISNLPVGKGRIDHTLKSEQ